MALALAQCGLSKIQAQSGLAHFRIGTVTTEASAGEDRLNILIEVKMLPITGAQLSAVTSGRRDQNQSRSRYAEGGFEVR
jgi:hypothetical protein